MVLPHVLAHALAGALELGQAGCRRVELVDLEKGRDGARDLERERDVELRLRRALTARSP